jgi:hypothetical protein
MKLSVRGVLNWLRFQRARSFCLLLHQITLLLGLEKLTLVHGKPLR